MPFFSPPYVVSCETQGKGTLCCEGHGRNRAPGMMFMSTQILMKHQVGNVVGTSQEILRPDLHCNRTTPF